MSHGFRKDSIEDRVELLESDVLNCFLKIIMADLCKIGLKVRE